MKKYETLQDLLDSCTEVDLSSRVTHSSGLMYHKQYRKNEDDEIDTSIFRNLQQLADESQCFYSYKIQLENRMDITHSCPTIYRLGKINTEHISTEKVESAVVEFCEDAAIIVNRNYRTRMLNRLGKYYWLNHCSCIAMVGEDLELIVIALDTHSIIELALSDSCLLDDILKHTHDDYRSVTISTYQKCISGTNTVLRTSLNKPSKSFTTNAMHVTSKTADDIIADFTIAEEHWHKDEYKGWFDNMFNAKIVSRGNFASASGFKYKLRELGLDPKEFDTSEGRKPTIKSLIISYMSTINTVYYMDTANEVCLPYDEWSKVLTHIIKRGLAAYDKIAEKDES